MTPDPKHTPNRERRRMARLPAAPVTFWPFSPLRPDQAKAKTEQEKAMQDADTKMGDL